MAVMVNDGARNKPACKNHRPHPVRRAREGHLAMVCRSLVEIAGYVITELT
jgi:hypothetical protein